MCVLFAKRFCNLRSLHACSWRYVTTQVMWDLELIITLEMHMDCSYNEIGMYWFYCEWMIIVCFAFWCWMMDQNLSSASNLKHEWNYCCNCTFTLFLYHIDLFKCSLYQFKRLFCLHAYFLPFPVSAMQDMWGNLTTNFHSQKEIKSNKTANSHTLQDRGYFTATTKLYE